MFLSTYARNLIIYKFECLIDNKNTTDHDFRQLYEKSIPLSYNSVAVFKRFDSHPFAKILQKTYAKIKKGNIKLVGKNEKGKNKKLILDNNKFKETIKKNNETISALTTQLKTLQNAHDDLQSKHSDLKSAHSDLQEKHSNLEERFNNLENTHKKLERTHKELEKKYNDMNAKYNELLSMMLAKNKPVEKNAKRRNSQLQNLNVSSSQSENENDNGSEEVVSENDAFVGSEDLKPKKEMVDSFLIIDRKDPNKDSNDEVVAPKSYP